MQLGDLLLFSYDGVDELAVKIFSSSQCRIVDWAQSSGDDKIKWLRSSGFVSSWLFIGT